MPGLQYWFSGTALFLAGSFAFTVAVGLIGIKEMISDRIFMFFLFAAVNLGLLAWYTAAKQERDSAEVRDSMQKIAASTNINPNQSAQALAEEILKKLPATEWHLTEKEWEKLGLELDAIPEHDRFPINIQALIGSTPSQMYKDDLGLVLHNHHWSVSGGVDLGLRPDSIGLFIAVSQEVKIVNYLHKMFKGDIRAIVPQIAMSGGTMIACSCHTILMGTHSNLGPIDPQLRGLPAYGVLEEFKRAFVR